MRKRVVGMVIAGMAAAFAAPAMAADYPPRQVYMPSPVYQPPVQPSCCCPAVRRGFEWGSFGCRARTAYAPAYPAYGAYPQYSYAAPSYYAQPYPQYYQPAYAPTVGVGVGVGPAGIGAGVTYR